MRRARAIIGLALLAPLGVAPRVAVAQRQVDPYEQQYLSGRFNWKFRDEYPAADRLFNGFDYGHSILYETLWRHPDAPVERLERAEFEKLTTRILRDPPRLALAEEAIEPEYAKLVPEARLMFEWAHTLHRQIYDVWADDHLSFDAKDRAVARLLRYYRSRPDLAFSSRPKSMTLMEGQPYSLVFRERYPKFNGLIWAYHWLQVGLYDALLAGDTPTARRANVDATVARFWRMIDGGAATMPHMMPMTPAVAPRFTARYPEAAVIFDNLHSMHDVISDILLSPKVPRSGKRAAILEAARRYRDDETAVTTMDEWRAMAAEMGVEHMGGAAMDTSSAAPPVQGGQPPAHHHPRR
ncbi:MAG TPA: hypothetical protein VHM30_10575 [Gemmatimonadaceae bacterium]|nr:hypothetical protein [Gemmatimonadaceae bacterium]